MQGSSGPFATNGRTTSATTHSHAKVAPVIPPGRPCHTPPIIVLDIDLYPHLTVANGFPLRNMPRIIWSFLLVEYRADSVITQLKVFLNVGNLSHFAVILLDSLAEQLGLCCLDQY
jgi:hypothetical protein